MYCKSAALSAIAAVTLSLSAFSANAMTFNWAFTSGGATSASATDGAFMSTITADGGQQFNYPSSAYLRSAGGVSGDTLTITFSEAIDSLSFDIGSLDEANSESVVFSVTPTLSAVGAVDWAVGGAASLSGNTVSHSGVNGSTGRVSFTGLGGITSFTWTETFNAHAIYYDNFTASTTSTAVVPLPAAFPLLAGGLGLFGLVARRKKTKSSLGNCPIKLPTRVVRRPFWAAFFH